MTTKPREEPLRVGDMTFYDVKEISEVLGVTIQTIRKYLKSGKLISKKAGKKRYVTETNLKKFLGNDESNFDDVHKGK